MLRVYVVAKDHKGLHSVSDSSLDPTEKQGSSLFLRRDREKGGLGPITWIPS